MNALITSSSARWIQWLINAPECVSFGVYECKSGDLLYWAEI